MLGVVDDVNRFFEACNSHDRDLLARCYAPNVFLTTPGGQADGCEEAVSFHEAIWGAFPDMKVTALQTIVQGDDVAAATVIGGTHAGPLLLPGGGVVPATNRPLCVRSCWIFTIQDSLIVSHQLYWDQLEMYVQLGLPLPRVLD